MTARGPDGRFVKQEVPGHAGSRLDEPITVLDIEWTPDDAGPLGCPIGVALALEKAKVTA